MKLKHAVITRNTRHFKPHSITADILAMLHCYQYLNINHHHHFSHTFDITSNTVFLFDHPFFWTYSQQGLFSRRNNHSRFLWADDLPNNSTREDNLVQSSKVVQNQETAVSNKLLAILVSMANAHAASQPVGSQPIGTYRLVLLRTNCSHSLLELQRIRLRTRLRSTGSQSHHTLANEQWKHRDN